MKLVFYLAFIFNSAILNAQVKIDTDNLNFKQTIKLINHKLDTWCEKGNIVKLTAQPNGYIRITNKRKQSFVFNSNDLVHSEYNDIDKEGVGIRFCDIKTHVPLSWMHFYTAKGSVAFIRLQCNIPKTELELLQESFIHLKALCKK